MMALCHGPQRNLTKRLPDRGSILAVARDDRCFNHRLTQLLPREVGPKFSHRVPAMALNHPYPPQPDHLLLFLARWLHILSATLAVGVPIYIWWVQNPALKTLDEPARSNLREALARRWRFLVYLIILIFLVTGFYNFLVVKRWENFPS